MTCSVCGTISDSASANTGRDEYFGPPITTMTKYHLADRDDLWECPECHAVFQYSEYVALTGSGNNDDETLTRLDATTAETIRHVRHHDASWSNAGLRALPERLCAIQADSRSLVEHLIPSALVRALVPHLLDAAGRDPWLAGLVKRYVVQPEHAHDIAAELAKRPDDPALAELRAHVREIGCSICPAIAGYPATQVNREALGPLAAMKQHNNWNDTLGIWVCPECASMFTWNDGKLRRNHPVIAVALRACIQRTGPVAKTAMETVLACGQDLAEPVLAYALANDGDLLAQFMPLLIERRHTSGAWLRAFLAHLDMLGSRAR